MREAGKGDPDGPGGLEKLTTWHKGPGEGVAEGAQESILGSCVQKERVRQETGQPLEAKAVAVAMTAFDDTVSEGPSLALVESSEGW